MLPQRCSLLVHSILRAMGMPHLTKRNAILIAKHITVVQLPMQHVKIQAQIKQISLSVSVPCAMHPAFPSGSETQAWLRQSLAISP